MATLPAVAQTSFISDTGTLHSPQGTAYITFSLTAADTITLKTWGFGGGTNAAGSVIAAGGFDPLLTLATGIVSAASIYLDGSNNPVAGADNLVNPPWSVVDNCPSAGTVQIGTNNDCGDVKITVALAAGTYTLMVTDANYEPSALYDQGPLSAPFLDLTGGEFHTCDPVADACVTRNGKYAVDIVGTKNSLVAFSKCDINQDATTNATDVQLMIKEALGTNQPANDLSGNGGIKGVDVQLVINGALNRGCEAK